MIFSQLIAGLTCWEKLLQVAWEHEQFSRQRITAATLSQLEEAPEFLDRTGASPTLGIV